MVTTVDIKFEGLDKTIDFFEKTEKGMVAGWSDISRHVADLVVEELRRGKQMAGIDDWTGELERSLKVVQTGEGQFSVMLPAYALYLEKMKSHFVPIYTTNMRLWINSRNPLTQEHGAPEGVKGKLYVVSHPFIDLAL